MKKMLVIIGLSVVLFSCTKKANNVCSTCVITKSIHSATMSLNSKDTVIYCGENEQDINSFIRSNTRTYSAKDSSNTSSILCH